MPGDALGRMRERVTVLRPATSADAILGRTTTWATLDTLPAEMVPVRASDVLAAQALQTQIQYRFRVRARGDVLQKMRVLWTPTYPLGSARKTLEITGVTPVEDGRMFMFLDCIGAQG